MESVAKNCANFRPFQSQAVGYRSRGTCEVCGVPWQNYEVGELYRCNLFTPKPTPTDAALLQQICDKMAEVVAPLPRELSKGDEA